MREFDVDFFLTSLSLCDSHRHFFSKCCHSPPTVLFFNHILIDYMNKNNDTAKSGSEDSAFAETANYRLIIAHSCDAHI